VRVGLVRAGWTLLVVLLVLVVLRTTVADVYRVGSGSMRPTIFGGPDPRTGEVQDERLLVRFGGADDLARFDLAVVRREPEPPIVKRVAGLPGESVAVVGGDLFVDGARLPLEPTPRPSPDPVLT
jgi:signal peptidase I